MQFSRDIAYSAYEGLWRDGAGFVARSSQSSKELQLSNLQEPVLAGSLSQKYIGE